ncbi:MAG TPA: hypothetical protein VI461_03985 [Chitinophagaceae bacterium]|nr:hypothetical protein [Chitinophagaceae bacterium]
MRTFKDLYIAISYSLLIVQIGFISILLYNKFIYHRKLYYGGDQKIEEISLNYFYILKTLLYSTFVLIILWALLTPLAILSNKRTVVEEERVGMSKGVAGFIAAIVLLIVDPFGMVRWFTK